MDAHTPPHDSLASTVLSMERVFANGSNGGIDSRGHDHSSIDELRQTRRIGRTIWTLQYYDHIEAILEELKLFSIILSLSLALPNTFYQSCFSNAGLTYAEIL